MNLSFHQNIHHLLFLSSLTHLESPSQSAGFPLFGTILRLLTVSVVVSLTHCVVNDIFVWNPSVGGADYRAVFVRRIVSPAVTQASV